MRTRRARLRRRGRAPARPRGRAGARRRSSAPRPCRDGGTSVGRRAGTGARGRGGDRARSAGRRRPDARSPRSGCGSGACGRSRGEPRRGSPAGSSSTTSKWVRASRGRLPPTAIRSRRAVVAPDRGVDRPRAGAQRCPRPAPRSDGPPPASRTWRGEVAVAPPRWPRRPSGPRCRGRADGRCRAAREGLLPAIPRSWSTSVSPAMPRRRVDDQARRACRPRRANRLCGRSWPWGSRRGRRIRIRRWGGGSAPVRRIPTVIAMSATLKAGHSGWVDEVDDLVGAHPVERDCRARRRSAARRRSTARGARG